MKSRNGYNEYKNIDDMEYNDIPDNSDFKSNTLDLYSDDMAKKPVSDLFKGMKDSDRDLTPSGNEKSGYSRKHRNVKVSNQGRGGINDNRKPTSSKERKPVYIKDVEEVDIKPPLTKNDFSKKEPIRKVQEKSNRTGDREYRGHSSNFDFRNTKYSTEKIESIMEEKNEIENNKKQLDEFEKIRSGRGERKTPTSRTKGRPVPQGNKNQKMVAYIRIGSVIAFTVLLLMLTISTFQKAALNKEVALLTEANEKLRTEVAEASGVQLNLQSRIEEFEAMYNNSLVIEPVSPVNAEGESGNSEVQTTVPTTSTTLPTTHTVVSGDTLSSISGKYYNGDTMQYDKIKSASGITSNDLFVGQVLTIPQ